MQATRDIHSYPDTIGRGGQFVVTPTPLSVLPLSILLLSASLIGLCFAPATAQVAAPAQQAAAPSADDIKQREQELEATR